MSKMIVRVAERFGKCSDLHGNKLLSIFVKNNYNLI